MPLFHHMTKAPYFWGIGFLKVSVVVGVKSNMFDIFL